MPREAWIVPDKTGGTETFARGSRPLTLLDGVADVVGRGLGAKRIGTPVFARIVAQTTGGPDRFEPLLAQALETASRWLPSEVRRIAALGDFASGHVSALVEYAQGQTALVSAGTQSDSPPTVEAFVVGTRGVVDWERAAQPIPEPAPAGDSLSATGRRLLGAVRESVGTSRPVSFAGDVPEEEPPSDPGPSAVPEAVSKGRALRKTDPPLGILLVAGARTHQENYAADFAADPRCRLIGVTDAGDVPERRRRLNGQLAERLGIPLLRDLDQALQRDDVHVASVCAEPERRAELMVRCARAGKHLYLDKPLAASAEQAEAVADAVREAGVVSQMFSSVRSAAAGRLRDLVAGGALGSIRAIHFDRTFAKGPAGTVPIDRPRREHARPERFETIDSKREFYNVGVYLLVLLQWLLGRPVRRVFASTGNYFFAEHRRNDMEDFGAAIVELDDGLVATLACGRTGWRSHPMGGLDRTCLVGSRAAASIDAYRPRAEVWADELPWLPPPVAAHDPMGFWKSTMDEAAAAPKRAWIGPSGSARSDAAHFLDCVERGRPSDVSADLACDVLKTLMACYRSAATGQFVACGPPTIGQ